MDKALLERMDDHMVLSILNEKLRLECDSLSALLSLYELDGGRLMARMSQIGYRYDANSNQFKPGA
ncbi:DUF4250 domain-containing protein [Oceanisphaera psychrotolerans]|jgi:hypothetical protein|uniref:DUF4250 domain-containing protein n=1 Tax=Oceanisphaera psychrotolerans TaxID=1414654 RepID=A0A1J4QBQ2_9GAMM|nr:DUF4250 domain-containing protein [Oceanisphaera psychrotolerans]OIN07991.1 hypothetical protein BFR47_15860 [Oceanisphaera psychrotolerans]